MKTTSPNTNLKLLTTLAALLVTCAAKAGPPAEEPCIVTARFMHEAGQHDALADYKVALANANNGPTAEARDKAAKRATREHRNALETAKKQFAARKQLCHDLGEIRYNPKINPADFLSPQEIAADPNPLFPLVPGTTYNYRAVDEEGTETITFEITHRTRKILGVTCIVVHDAVLLDGSLIEDTDDWFAQDREGNVWYFGESTAEYEDGLITTTDGAWEAGVDSARPGIIMFAKPKVGKTYRQELFLDEAEDAAKILALDERVTVPAGTYSNCLKTKDFTPIDPGNFEYKYYAPGVGAVLEVNPRTGKRTELISVVKE